MKVMHVVGNRPQFIKLAPVSRELRKKNIEEIIIHTGQHYDENMSDVFFEELDIPKPAKNLEIGSGTHAETTARALLELEKVMCEFKPNCILIYGDTNSTLAATLVASKLLIPLIHIEAGPRTYNKKNPEECNRIVADHLSTILCAPDRNSVNNLLNEGINKNNIYFTGDVMYDEFLYCASQKVKYDKFKNFPEDYILLTWHRQENTSTKERMENMIDFLERINYPIIFPIHPRTRKMLQQYELENKIKKLSHLVLIEPVGYMEMVWLINKCKLLISDSGGASKEASFANKKCIYTLDLKVWPELIESGHIQIVNVDEESSVKNTIEEIYKILQQKESVKTVEFFGDGSASKKIADIVEKFLE